MWIAAAREQALAYVQTLPDFLCTQVTRRYSASSAPSTREPSWKPMDTLTIRLSYFGQKEDYRVVRINNKPVDKPLAKVGGSTARGDFGSMLKNVFTPKSETQFTWDRWDTWNGRRVAVFAYQIERAYSTFDSTVRGFLKPSTTIFGVKGLVEIDEESRQTLRLTIDSTDMPADSPVREVHWALDYDYRKIGGREFLLPSRSVTLLLLKSGRVKLDSEFTEYRKFSANTTIEFGK